MLKLDLEEQNRLLRHKTPGEIIEWALPLTKKRIVTTSFGVYSAVLLSTFSKKDPNIDIIWCDTGYNNYETYEHAQKLISDYNLNINIYVPRQTKAFTDVTLGLPAVDDPGHEAFTELVKLEPFRRMLAEHEPEVWFTNIRVRQTAYRNSLDILSYSNEGILKISPFYYWKDEDLDDYIKVNGLPKNTAYFDPVKAIRSRECGIHLIG
ncbi:MAG: phosphoadenosine phosphosulfate reductase family protein [Ekhidna sp.]|nr:phosphoadenosine phosphosulfate reductase family protein [Ekhidna sp.]MBC6411022.1 phosphoadenosine phosphosulfate reductase family protein [Ekhidna sp.]